MIYTAPDGIHVLDLDTRKTRLLVPNPPRLPGGEGRSDGALPQRCACDCGGPQDAERLLLADRSSDEAPTVLYKADMNTGADNEASDPAEGASGVATVNADETLAAGTMNDGPRGGSGVRSEPDVSRRERRRQQPTGAGSGTLVQPEGKGEMMERRLASRQPLILYTMNLQTGKLTTLLHSTDWVNHLLFSPTDPTLLMYCHEGPWQKVDRIWTIRTDGSQNTLIHQRTFAQEIAGHEFWGIDGKTLWYDWQPIKGEDFYLAGYDVATHRQAAFHMERNEWSIHFNVTGDESLFTGDGGRSGPGGEGAKWRVYRAVSPGDEAGRWHQHAGLDPAGHVPLGAPGEYGEAQLQAGAECAVFAGQEAGDLYQQHVRAELRLRRGDGEGELRAWLLPGARGADGLTGLGEVSSQWIVGETFECGHDDFCIQLRSGAAGVGVGVGEERLDGGFSESVVPVGYEVVEVDEGDVLVARRPDVPSRHSCRCCERSCRRSSVLRGTERAEDRDRAFGASVLDILGHVPAEGVHGFVVV